MGNKKIDFVETNPEAIKIMKRLFEEKGIKEEKYCIYEKKIEEFVIEKKYYIIIAEGFIPDSKEPQKIIDIIKELLSEEGIAVITCGNDRKYNLFENAKRMIAHSLVCKIENYEEKKKFLIDFFSEQLEKALPNMSRSVDSWVEESIIVPLDANHMSLTIPEAISMFGGDYDVYGTSQNMFTDYSWYKDVEYDVLGDYIKQYNEKQLSLLLVGMPEIQLSINIVDKIIIILEKISLMMEEYKSVNDLKKLDNEFEIIEKEYLCCFPEKFRLVFRECRQAIMDIQKPEFNIFDYNYFFEAFSRSLQYISFVKRSKI